MTAGADFVGYVVDKKGLEGVVQPAPVEIPEGETPRAGGVEEGAELGALAKLPGAWIGNGFNLIARPDQAPGSAMAST